MDNQLHAAYLNQTGSYQAAKKQDLKQPSYASEGTAGLEENEQDFPDNVSISDKGSRILNRQNKEDQYDYSGGDFSQGREKQPFTFGQSSKPASKQAGYNGYSLAGKSNRMTNYSGGQINSGFSQPGKTLVTMYPQDPLISKPEIGTLDSNLFENGLSNSRLEVSDNYRMATPDNYGNYVYKPSDPRADQVSTFYHANKTTEMYDKFFGRPVEFNTGGDPLKIMPHAGTKENSYYDRRDGTLRFHNYGTNTVSKNVKASQSSDMISHETGHAVLDGIKPGIYNGAAETDAFHESFGDTSAMLYTTTNESNLKQMYDETSNGNLSKHNRMSMLMEEFGTDQEMKYSGYQMRDGLNNKKYEQPAELCQTESSSKREPHNQSKVMTGAFYDSYKKIYDRKMKEINPEYTPNAEKPYDTFKDVVGQTTNELGKDFAKAVDLTPPTGLNFKKVALGMMTADVMNNKGSNVKDIAKSYMDRGVLSKEDINNYISENEKYQDLKLDSNVSSKNDALGFLKSHSEELGVNPNYFTNASVKRDEDGNTFLNYESNPVKIGLRQLGPPYNTDFRYNPGNVQGVNNNNDMNNLHVKTKAGMTLAFDKDGDFISRMDDAIDNEKLKQIKGSVTQVKDLKKDCYSNGQVYF